MSQRANALADRIEQGADTLATFAESLTDAEWRTPVPGDGRTVGVMIHHVASVYPIELDLARTIASGKPIEGVTWGGAVAQINAKHASEHATAGKKETLDLLRRNSRVAATAVRAFTDIELDRAASVSLNEGATLTAQFIVEDHAVRHCFHHLARIRAALKR